MIKVENVETYGWEAAVRGMRNPMNSWDRSDSIFCDRISCDKCRFVDECDKTGMMKDHVHDGFAIGPADLRLMDSLARMGSTHAKFRRQIAVSMDITAPSFWWPEFDTYKVGTVRNSCSKMHRLHVKEFEYDDFSHEGADELSEYRCNTVIESIIDYLNKLRDMFNATGEKKYWRAMLEVLPHGYNMRATVTLNYEVLSAMYRDRREHKLKEWRDFCAEIEKLPYSELFTLPVTDLSEVE